MRPRTDTPGPCHQGGARRPARHGAQLRTAWAARRGTGSPCQTLEWTVWCVVLFDDFPHPSTGPGPDHLARLTRQLGIPALEACCQRVTGGPLPRAVRAWPTGAGNWSSSPLSPTPPGGPYGSAAPRRTDVREPGTTACSGACPRHANPACTSPPPQASMRCTTASPSGSPGPTTPQASRWCSPEPTTRRGPTPWFVWVKDYPGIGSQLAARDPLTLPAGGAATRGLRTLLADGALGNEAIQTWADATAPDRAPVTPRPGRTIQPHRPTRWPRAWCMRSPVGEQDGEQADSDAGLRPATYGD